MRAITLTLIAFICASLAGCASVPSLPELPGLPDGAVGDDPGPFRPRDEYPHAPNVARMIGEEDCRGATLAAVSAQMPDYPRRAYQRGRQGWVVIRFDVEPDGGAENVRVARSVPAGVFDGQARRAVREWRFQPLDTQEPLLNCVVMFEFRAGEVRVR